MPVIDLAASFVLKNGTKLDISDLTPGDSVEIATFAVVLRMNSAAGSTPICGWQMRISNTTSTKAARVGTQPAGLEINDVRNYVDVTTRATPTGYTDLMNAWRAGATPNARDNAFKAHLYAAGHFDVSLAASP